jgi:hypothetical protein
MEAVSEPEVVDQGARKDEHRGPAAAWRARPRVAPAWLRISIPCPLCRVAVEALCEFRRTEIDCPNCGLTFAHDPSAIPLAVPGVRLAPLGRQEEPEPTPSGRSYRWLITGLGLVGAIAAGLAGFLYYA